MIRGGSPRTAHRGRPHRRLPSAQALYRSLAALPERLVVELDLRVAEGPFWRASFHLSDGELTALTRTPERVGTLRPAVIGTLEWKA